MTARHSHQNGIIRSPQDNGYRRTAVGGGPTFERKIELPLKPAQMKPSEMSLFDQYRHIAKKMMKTIDIDMNEE